MDFLSRLCESHPMLVSTFIIWVLWAATSYFMRKNGAIRVGSQNGTRSYDEAIKAARERQQQRLEAIAAARSAKTPSSLIEPSASAQTSPTATDKSNKRSASDKESYTQRLARLEKGKGPSGNNPLNPAAKKSSYSVCHKKGG